MSVNYNRVREVADISAVANVEGDTGWGVVKARGTGSEGLKIPNPPAAWEDGDHLEDAFNHAVTSTEQDLVAKLRRIRPPSNEDLRNTAFTNLINQYIR